MYNLYRVHSPDKGGPYFGVTYMYYARLKVFNLSWEESALEVLSPESFTLPRSPEVETYENKKDYLDIFPEDSFVLLASNVDIKEFIPIMKMSLTLE